MIGERRPYIDEAVEKLGLENWVILELELTLLSAEAALCWGRQDVSVWISLHSR